MRRYTTPNCECGRTIRTGKVCSRCGCVSCAKCARRINGEDVCGGCETGPEFNVRKARARKEQA